tara:strand:- start:54 stop:452 length:399 start_codon:yes stop_codon:yes gene_type:complete
MKRLTVEQIDNELRKLMDEQPNFRYNTSGTLDTCYYHQGPAHAPEKCNGCIFGQAFQRLGITKETLAILHDPIETMPNTRWMPHNRPYYWSKIQARQDKGNTWGSLKEHLPNENDNPHQSAQDSQQPQVGQA